MEKLGGIPEVKYLEMPLAFVLTYSCTTANNLFELSHGLNLLVYYDQAACLAINTRGKHLRSSDDCRIRLVHIDEIIKLFLALIIIASDLHDIAMVLLTEVGVEVGKKLTHGFCLLYIRAENNCFCHSTNLLQHLGYTPGHNLPPFVYGEFPAELLPAEVFGFDNLSVKISLPFFRDISSQINAKEGIGDAVRCQETILDTLFQRVGVDRIAEIIKVVGSIYGLRSSRHADLCCR